MSAPTLIGLLLAFVAVSFVVAPLLWPSAFGIGVATAPEAFSDEDEDVALEALRDDVYAQIVELDFEQAVGKTDEEEYRQERAALKRRALAVLRTLDERAAAAPEGIEDAIEREVLLARARRAEGIPEADLDETTVPDLNAEVERQILALRRSRRANVARAD
jgi:hypothetical protein